MSIEEKLNLKYYSGVDTYSDGDVEDTILDIVRNHEDLETFLQTNQDWAYLYHFSNVRKNLLEWYPFNPEGTLLEIGSGCGAMSGLFCEKVQKVTAIELSKKRSTINATRNKEYDNLEIMVGNFQDIQLDEKFDYVTLIGVFEYSIYYLSAENPFDEMIRRAKAYLKPGGTLIIAIENKYGLKYFAGAREDHTGEVFDGIQGYHNIDRIRTFSKDEIKDIITRNGFGDVKFYYPFPDYKMPETIYSDDRLPRIGELRNTERSYDRNRYSLFSESLVYDELCKDHKFQEFSNSFLIFSK